MLTPSLDVTVMLLTTATVVYLLLHSSHAWVLEQTHTDVHVNYTSDVSLSCVYGNHSSNEVSAMSEVLAIVMRKRDSNGEFETIAKVRVEGQAELTSNGADVVSVSGQASHLVTDSFLTLTWSRATERTVGQFVCEVHGFSLDDGLVKDVTAHVTISETPMSLNDLLGLVTSVKSKSRQIGQLAKSVNEDMDAIWTEAKTNIIYPNNENDDNNTSSTTTNITVTTDALIWPAGCYTLPEPASGCPTAVEGDATHWVKYWLVDYKVWTEDEALRLSSNLKTQMVITPNDSYSQSGICHRCSSRDYKHSPWPRGDYCLKTHNNANCSDAFGYTNYINPDLEHGASLELNGSSPDWSNWLNGTCCRQDGNATEPIKLPTDQPFYLFGFGDVCQAVEGMSVTREEYWTKPIDPPNHHPGLFKYCYYTKN